MCDDGNGGDHVLDFEARDVPVSVDETPSFLLALPGVDSDFYKLDLTQDKQAELEKVEK